MSSTQPTLDDVWRLFHKTTLKFHETDRQMKGTDRKIKEMTANIGKLGNRLDDFIEDAMRPSAMRLFCGCGIAVHEAHQNVRSQRGDGDSRQCRRLCVPQRAVCDRPKRRGFGIPQRRGIQPSGLVKPAPAWLTAEFAKPKPCMNSK